MSFIPPARSHTKILLFCLVCLVWGTALVTAAVPLYRLFCQHFGIPVPRIITGPAPQALPNSQSPIPNPSRTVTVRFTANSASGLPITFGPATYTQKVKLGEPVLTAYLARNNVDKAYDGVAVHMLYAMGGDPDIDIASYVDLQQCFCFAQEHYPANQEVRLPLSFTISPNLPAGVHTITFSYTLFEALPNDPRIKKTPPKATNG